MTSKPTIAIDGPAASGKGTLARKIAEKLGYAHMDTGLLYRAVAHMVLEAGAQPNEALAVIKAAQRLSDGFKGGTITYCAPFEAEDVLKTEKVTEAASLVASMADVRRILLDMQKAFAADPGPTYLGTVLDGRDIGTVICPDAKAKLYVTAALETRAERRFKELQNKGVPVTYEAVLRDMSERDARDAARSAAPMKAALDAVVLDTTNLNQGQALEKALEIVQAALNGR